MPHQASKNCPMREHVYLIMTTLIETYMHHQASKNCPILFHGWRGNQSKRPHSKTATTRTATLSGITTRTATLLWSKRPHCFGQNGHIGWVATKTATFFWSKRPHPYGQNGHKVGFTLNEQKWLPKRPHCIWSKRPQIVSDINFVKSE